MTGGLTGKWKK